MKRLLVLLPLIAFAAGCIKPTGSTSSDSTSVRTVDDLFAFEVSSDDGSILGAMPTSGQFSWSVNKGSTWLTQTASPKRVWTDLQTSSDGSTFVAVGHASTTPTVSELWVSTDYGTSWSNRAPSAGFNGMAALAKDGLTLVAAYASGLQKSTDAGRTWQSVSTYTVPTPVGGLALSRDGSKVIVLGNDGARSIATSDVGAVSSSSVGGSSPTWLDAVVSTTGTRRVLLALEGTDTTLYRWSGTIWARSVLATKADRLVANAELTEIWALPPASQKGQPSLSTDGGVTWMVQTDLPAMYWTFLDASASGNLMVMAGRSAATATLDNYTAYTSKAGVISTQGGSPAFSWTVIFDDGTTPVVKTVVSPATTVVDWPSDPVNADTAKFFAGWVMADLTTPFTKSTAVLANQTVKATWSSKPSVTFDANGGTPVPGTQQVVPGALVSAPSPAPTRDGYTLTNWMVGTTSTVWNFATDTMPSAALTLKAQWSPATYHVLFHANGGDGSMASQAFTYQTNGSLTSNSFTRTGYTFAGWNTKADKSGSSFIDHDNYLQSTFADVDLYAQWTAVTVNVLYFGNGADGGSTATTPGAYNKTVNVETNGFTRTGYAFVSWNTKADGTGVTYPEGSSIVLNQTADLNLYARWQINTYKVSFVTNGGTAIADQMVAYDSTASAPTNPTRPGYTFGGWYSDAGLTTPWASFSTKIKATTTLYALWSANQTVSATISFPSGQTTAITSATVAKGTPLTASVTGSFSSVQWYLDGTALAGQTTMSLSTDTSGLAAGRHEILVLALSGSTLYSGRVTVEVTN